MSLDAFKELIRKAYEEPLSLTAETAKEVISIEREYFYGDMHNNQRLRRIREILNQNFKKYEKENVSDHETP